MDESLRNIDAIPGDCLTRAELRSALGIGQRAVLETPAPDCRDTTGQPAWTKTLVRRWLRNELPADRNRITERTIR